MAKQPKAFKSLWLPSLAGTQQETKPALELVTAAGSEAYFKKATVRPRVLGARLVDSVPPAYREAVAQGARPDGAYSVLLFAHAERDVVTSTEVKKALRQLKTAAPDGVLLVGTVFTLEARVLAAVQGARIVSMHNAVWTDASAAARQR